MKAYDKIFQEKWEDAKYVCTSQDWMFVQTVLDKLDVNIAVEFGAGPTTLWLSDVANRVVSYETNDGWIDRVKSFVKGNVDVRTWNGMEFMDTWPNKFDVAFVDGPFHAHQRGPAVQAAAKLSNNVILHDWHDAPTKEWAKMYLEPAGFKLMATGGRLYNGEPVVAYFKREPMKAAKVVKTKR